MDFSKRFLLFTNEEYSYSPAMTGLKGSFDSVDDAISFLRECMYEGRKIHDDSEESYFTPHDIQIWDTKYGVLAATDADSIYYNNDGNRMIVYNDMEHLPLSKELRVIG